MLKILVGFFGAFLMTSLGFAEGIAEIPEATKQEMCRLLSDQNKPCVAGQALQYSRIVKLDDDQLLAFFHKRNDENHVQQSIPLILDEKGEWRIAQTFIGQPERIQKDEKGRLWMQGAYFFLDNRPVMNMSLNGREWKEIPLPFDNDSGKSFYQRNIERWCVTGDTLFLELLMSSKTNVMSKQFWQANIKYLLEDGGHSRQKWQVSRKQSLDGLACESVKAKNNAWEVQEGESLSLLLLDKKKLTIKLPKHVVVGAQKANPITKPEEQATETAAKKGKFAIQVAAYRQHELSNGVVKILQQAKFTTFTRTLVSNGQSLKKVYIGPFDNRNEATKNLATFKEQFKDNGSYESAFVLQLP